MRVVLGALHDKRALLNQAHHVNLRIKLGRVALELFYELLSQHVIGRETVSHNALEVHESVVELPFLVIVCEVLSRGDVRRLQLTLAYKLYITLNMLKFTVQVVECLSEVGVAGFGSSLVQSLEVALGSADQLLIHLVVLLSNDIYYLHCSCDALAYLVEV